MPTGRAAAATALAAVLVGEPQVITHGDVAASVAGRLAAIDRALPQLAARADGGRPA
jgi:hypothetical protein